MYCKQKLLPFQNGSKIDAKWHRRKIPTKKCKKTNSEENWSLLALKITKNGSKLLNSFLSLCAHSLLIFHVWPELHSVTRWPDYFSVYGHLHWSKFARYRDNFAKFGSKCCKILIKPIKIDIDFQNLSNPVTLELNNNK